MRLLYDQNAHDRERQSWRAVVHLNLITAVRLLVEAVEAFDIDGTSGSSSPTPSAMEGMRMPLSPTQARGEGTSSSASNRALLARLRLAPLLSLETILRRRLGAAGEETDLSDPALAQNQQGWGSRTDPSSPSGRSNNNTLLLKAGWQDRLLSRLGVGNEDNSDTASIAESTSPKQQRRILGRRRSSSAIGRRKERDTSPAPPLPDAANTLVARKEDDPGKMLEALKEDILQLWSEPVVRRLRRKGKLDATDSAS